MATLKLFGKGKSETGENNPLISIIFEKSTISTAQFNQLVAFISCFVGQFGKESLTLYFNDYPLRLNGQIEELSSMAKRYFMNWNNDNFMRNIRIVYKNKK